MKNKRYIGFISAVACVCLCNALCVQEAKGDTSSGDAAGETFSIDPVHSTALFRVHHMGAGPFWGRFNDVTGTIVFHEGSTDGLSMEIEISIKSIDTSSKKLDGHIKSEDFFFEDEYPKATFKSSSARKITETRYELSGDLTLRGVTKAIKVNVDWLGTADGRRGRKIGFETDFTVKRSDFGINYGLGGGALGDDTRIIIGIEARAVDSAKRGASMRPGKKAAPRTRTGASAALVSLFDKNGDGKLQRDEAPAGMRKTFDKHDTNKDGGIDEEEMTAMRKARRSGRSGD